MPLKCFTDSFNITSEMWKTHDFITRIIRNRIAYIGFNSRIGYVFSVSDTYDFMAVSTFMDNFNICNICKSQFVAISPFSFQSY